MSNLSIPFNVSLLDLTPEKLVGLRPVRSLDAFEGSSKNFHEDGLFSVLTFGRVGDERRNRRYSYIDIKIPIFHPVIYRALGQLKRLYPEILSGKTYAVFNPETKDFEKSNAMDGETGFHFFVKHWKEIEFEERPSDQREENIKLLTKYQDTAMLTKVIVMPAGLRDIEIQADGRTSEDEINNLYRKILSIANTIPQVAVDNNPEMLNNPRHSLQQTFILIYDLLRKMVEGKKKHMMGKWASRNIANGTRNVITSMSVKIPDLNSPGKPTINSTIVGLYQYIKATLPITKYKLKSGFLSQVFVGPSSPVYLVNKKTLKKEAVNLRSEYFDAYMTDEGLEKVITMYGEESLRHRPLEIEGYYVGLIYKGPNNTFKLFQDIDELPEIFNKDDVSPMTFTELMYISVYEKANTYPLFVTRYPISSAMSIYPSFTYLRSTVESEVRYALDDNWEKDGSKEVAYEFPLHSSYFVNSLSPHSTRLGVLNAD